MLSLFAQRAVTRFPSVYVAGNISKSRVLPLLSQTHVQTRRTFLTAPLVHSPAKTAAATKAKTSVKTAKIPAARKTTAKKPLKKKKKAAKPKKRVVAKKKKVATKKKPSKPKRVVVRPGSGPPKSPPGPYLLFYTKYLKSQPQATSLADTNAYAKTAGAMWRSLSAEEKKPFEDEHGALYMDYVKKRGDYYNAVDRSLLREINRRRLNRGAKKFKKPPVDKEKRKPVSGFFRYLAEFRASPEGEAIKASENKEGKSSAVAATVAGSKNWKNMSDAEKRPYDEAYQRDRLQWINKHGAKTK